MAVLATVALIVIAGWGEPASAQTIQELKAQLEALQQQILRLEAEQARMQAEQEKLRAEQVMTAEDQAKLIEKTTGITPNKPAVTSGKAGVKLAVSGQANRGVLYANNGDDAQFFHVDNDNSSTRVRWIGIGQFDENNQVGAQIEVQFESNSTAAIRIDQDGPAGPNNFTERKLEVWGDNKTFGRLWVGQGDTASNGTSEQDLSRTDVVGYSGIADMAGGIAFSGRAGLGPRINQAFSNLDGLSRDDRVRYDTPKFHGFQFSTSVLERNDWDAAARYRGDISGTKVVGAVAFADATERRNFTQINGSASVLFPFGFNITAAGGTRDIEHRSDDVEFFYGKLGYIFEPFPVGTTALAVDFTQVNDLAREDDEFRSVGAFIVQHFDRIATEFYTGIRHHELDRPGDDFDDIFAVLSGARVKF
jgi:hypothetical protein